jgi:uncharacterized damage-inducible protein DinB
VKTALGGSLSSQRRFQWAPGILKLRGSSHAQHGFGEKSEETRMNREDILTLYDYNAWANARTLGAAEPLTSEAFLRDLGNSFPSVRDTLAHILGAEWIWLRRWHGESPSHGLPATEFPTPASLQGRFAAIERERHAFLEGVPDDRLAQPFSYRDMAGNGHTLLLVHSLQHVVNHGTYHRGQITTMLRQLGAKPVSTDMSRFYLDRGLGA